MKKLLLDNKVNFLFFFISFIFLAGFIGVENIFFHKTDWLYKGTESSYHHIGWYFFKNDIWRFPLGSNPNYGGEFGSSIVFTDSMPFFAIIFKLFKSFLPENFQYFSFWYFICFYFQLFFSFKILKKFTNSTTHSLVGSIFFLIAPIFIFRSNWHAAVSGQWILLLTLYLALTHENKKSKLHWVFLIIFSSLINYSFTAVTLVSYLLLRILHLYFKKENFLRFIKDFFTITALLLLTAYIVGYFEIRMGDTLGVGFGYYKLNLVSIFDPVNSINNISWSWFLPDIKLATGEELEGFNYFGLGQILMLLFALVLYFNKNYKEKLFSVKNNKEIKIFIIISLLLTLWALTNKISFGTHTFEIPLNKYVFGVFSIFKMTGRIFWIVNYFLLIFSIIIIYNCFNKKKSLIIIILFLIIQAGDTSAGLKERINFFSQSKEYVGLRNNIWDDLFTKYKTIKTTYPVSFSGHGINFTYFMEKYKIEKTNMILVGRINRKAVAEARYRLYDNFHKKNLESNTVYIVHGQSHLKHLKKILENENIGFFYRDNIWSFVANEKGLMSNNDQKMFQKIRPKLLPVNEVKNLYFESDDSYYGLGWSHNSRKLGIWSEGKISTLLFRTDKNYGKIKLEIFCQPYITRKNKILEFDVYVNGYFNKNIKLSNENLEDKKIEILIDEKIMQDNEAIIDFNFKNLVSPYEILESPDSRKLGILVKNIKIIPI